MNSLTISIIFTIFLIKCIASEDLFPLTIIHLNDMHARFEETNLLANTCKENEKCIGGYARVVSKVRELKANSPNPIYMNAADNYQGTYWFNLFSWNATQYFLDLEPADVMTMGNHEFDNGVEGLMPFLERIKSPVISCNFDASKEPEFAKKFTNTIILERSGTKIGIVGVTTTFASNWGQAKVLPEVENVRREVENLVRQGIKIIIVLSHSGLKTDRDIAKHGGPIDLIVGGHSHSFLFSGEPVGPDKPVSDYPTIETQENGRKVLIVQASAYNKYLGNIKLFFDEDGEVKRHEGAPIFLSNDVPQDPEILKELAPWKAEVDVIQRKVVGAITHEYDSYCYRRECGMGNLVADSMAYAFLNESSEGEWTGATIALQGPGGVRAGLTIGQIIYADLVTTTPFENYLISMELPGHAIREALEFAVADESSLMVLQVSGIKVVYDLKRKPNDRIVELKVLCQKCDIPRYEDIISDKYYRVVAAEYFAGGGDKLTMIPKYARNHIKGPKDIEALEKYVLEQSPINIPGVLGRIQFV